MSVSTIVLLGDAADARGFRLAGVASVVCRTAADVDRALRQLDAAKTHRQDVVLVSRSVYRVAADRIDAVSAAAGPMVLVLPATAEGGSR